MSACCLNFRSVDVIFTYYVKGKPLFEMCCFHMGIAQIALDPLGPPSVKRANVKKSAPDHPGKPYTPPPLRAMPIWKQHISKRGSP